MGGNCKERTVGGIKRDRKTGLHKNKKQKTAVGMISFNSNSLKTRNGISYYKRFFKALYAKY